MSSYWKVGYAIQRGRYVLDKVLGAGGAGITYRAKDTKTDEVVAIKTLNATIQAQPDFTKHQERFIQEAFRLAKCSHPHVIQVDDVCQEGELWCMVMEYIDGGNLETLVKQKGGFSEAEAIKYISEVGSALTYIHEQGILHRDVKPANIMLRKEKNEAVLIDFGLARDFIEDKTQIHTNSRTEGFAPLEQYLRSAKRGAYTDVYALAATLYYLLTLQIPFPAQFRNQGINLIPPQNHNQSLSNRTNYAIIKGMELEAENRPQSVAEWLGLLVGDTEIMSSESPTVVETQPPVAIKPQSSPVSKTPMIPPLPPLPILPHKRVKKSVVARQTRNTSYDPLSPERFTQHSNPSQAENISPTETPFMAGNINLTTPTEIAQPETNIKSEATKLPSAVGIDYTNLEELLKNSQWQDANKLTNKLMLQVVNKEDSGWIDRNTMRNFPCEDLQTIDKLWVKYSKGGFGFSVQKRVYQSLGGKREYDKRVWEAIGDRLGWRVNGAWLFEDDLKFDLTAPQGHLPSIAISGLLERGIYTLMSRTMDCTL